MADEVMVMYGGRAVEFGTTRQILTHPEMPYTWGLLSSVPDVTADPDARQIREILAWREANRDIGVEFSTFHRFFDALENKDYAAALKFYEQAEPLTADPGLVAFNKGATLIRLGRHREAELCYLRCLQDRAAPAQRRSQGAPPVRSDR